MKRKMAKKMVSSKKSFRFDKNEFLLLAFVALSLLVFFAAQNNLLPPFLSPSVLGLTAGR